VLCCLGYPNESAVHVALKTVRDWLAKLAAQNKVSECSGVYMLSLQNWRIIPVMLWKIFYCCNLIFIIHKKITVLFCFISSCCLCKCQWCRYACLKLRINYYYFCDSRFNLLDSLALLGGNMGDHTESKRSFINIALSYQVILVICLCDLPEDSYANTCWFITIIIRRPSIT